MRSFRILLDGRKDTSKRGRKVSFNEKELGDFQKNVRETMDEMETLCRITYEKRRGQLLTEMDKIQRRIVDVFGVKLPAC